MILGHVVYKVTDLDAGVDDFRARGFAVEYGRPKNPINALAYFSEGPYFELLARTGTPKVLKKLTALVGGRRWRALSRLASWDDRAEGLCGLCLEGDSAQFRSAVRALNDDGLELGPHRTDTKGRTLRYRVFFPADQDLPCLAALGLAPRSLFDTELAARLLGRRHVGLGAVLEETLGLRLAKDHAAADWSTRPLPETWLVYAALDVELLIELRAALADELAAAGKADWAAQEFEYERTRPPRPAKTDPWRRIPRAGRVGPGRGAEPGDAAPLALRRGRGRMVRGVASVGGLPRPRVGPRRRDAADRVGRVVLHVLHGPAALLDLLPFAAAQARLRLHHHPRRRAQRRGADAAAARAH